MPTEMKLKTVMKGLKFHNVKDGRILENMKEEIQTQLVAWERVLKLNPIPQGIEVLLWLRWLINKSKYCLMISILLWHS